MLPSQRPVILASASPRRNELLRELVPRFEVLASGVDEDDLACENPIQTAEQLAERKARAVFALRPHALIIAADTVVAVAGIQLAKPADAPDACRMLGLLSGREHEVITGVCLRADGLVQTFSDRTSVRFRELTDEEIAAYVSTGEPMDKAGAYAIQGGAAGFVESVNGSWSNVVGLPMEMLRERLATLAGG